MFEAASRVAWPFRPERFEQEVACHELVRVQQKEHEQSTLLRPCERNDPGVRSDLERAEKSEAHSPPLRGR